MKRARCIFRVQFEQEQLEMYSGERWHAVHVSTTLARASVYIPRTKKKLRARNFFLSRDFARILAYLASWFMNVPTRTRPYDYYQCARDNYKSGLIRAENAKGTACARVRKFLRLQSLTSGTSRARAS